MIQTPWLVIDVHYLCHRAFHTSKTLSWKGKPTGVVFGFLKSISFLKDEFQTDRVAFCFEHRHLLRRDVYPEYKRRRHTKERTPEEKESYSQLAIQIHELHHRYLPKIGFKNVFCSPGYESDDVMAAIALSLPPEEEEAVLVTGDTDLLQCLRPNVTVYSPQLQRLWTDAKFQREYGVTPRQWAKVKAIAGCHTDEVRGVPGVGEITALKYVRGELKETDAKYKAIRSRENRAIVRRNRALVELPFSGCLAPTLQEDRVRKEDWVEVCDLLGMKSLAGRPPVATRTLGIMR